MPMYLVSGDSGDLNVSAFVEANGRQEALDMHMEFINTQFQVYGDEMNCPRNVWQVPSVRGVLGVLEWKIDVTLTEGSDNGYRSDDDDQGEV